MAWLLGMTASSDDNYNGDVDVVLVDLTADLAKLVLKRIQLHKQVQQVESDLYKLYFWDLHAEYYRIRDWELFEKGLHNRNLLDAYHDYQWIEIPDDWDREEILEYARTDCSQMRVDDRNVKFTASPKHTDLYVSSPEISEDMLNQATQPRS